MRTLLNADPSYLRKEAQSIYQAAYRNCREQIFRPVSERMRYGEQIIDESLMAIDEGTRELLGVADEQALNDAVSTYAEQVARSRQIMKQVGIQ